LITINPNKHFKELEVVENLIASMAMNPDKRVVVEDVDSMIVTP
jgi:hypothetical protein